jgi:hypothetical protein
MNTVDFAKGPRLREEVARIVDETPVFDIHTHLYDPAFGDLLLWGIDDLLVYHYLVAESFRYLDVPYQEFWALPKISQAELIWNALFLQHSPVSEACRGVLTTLHALGLDPRKGDLRSLRGWFAGRKVEDYTSLCMDLSGVRKICMTNSPFDGAERPVWDRGFQRDERFAAALRIDPLLLQFPQSVPQLREWGYDVAPELSQRTLDEVRRFLADWTRRIQPLYCMVSLPPDFSYPNSGPSGTLIAEAVLPHCREFNLPFAVMPGVKRSVNPGLALAGDGIGLSDLSSLQHLCAANPGNKFLATVLSRENQHELCVLARKFRNLHIFGCWWFTNIPVVIEEMTRMRLELLGLSFTPQHSDARVLDQIIYKWRHSKKILASVLADKYEDLAATGWTATPAEIRRDVEELLGAGFERFCES